MAFSIRDWYANKNIFITGATGFMGKVLVEKLLRSCSDLKSISLLVRSKKGLDPQQRLKDIINSPIFYKLRNHPDGEKKLAKLHVICGDVTQHNLNLQMVDAEQLKEHVNIVFHMAANVRFDQSLDQAMTMITKGTLEVLDFCCMMNNLEAVVHVSTAYSQCDETVLEERVYTAPYNPRKLLDTVAWMDDDLLQWLTPKLLKNCPNTYSFTKGLTEHLVAEYASKLPILIVRPAIVAAAWKEPIPGWIEGMNGPTGIIVGAGKGALRTMLCNAETNSNIVPVDIVINTLIILACKLGKSSIRDEPLVYNITSDEENPLIWEEMLKLCKKHVLDNPFSLILWYPNGSFKSSYVEHVLSEFFFHTIPAYIVDSVLVLSGNKSFLVHVQKRIHKGLEVLHHYTTRHWYFHTEKIKELRQELSDVENKEFYTSTANINWDNYMLNYVLGIRKYCLHEDLDTLPQARKVVKRMYYLDMGVKVVLKMLLVWFIVNIFVNVAL